MNPRLWGGRLACMAALLGAALPAAAQSLRAPKQPAPPAAVGSAPSRSAEPLAADFIVAVVNSEPITNNEVRTRMLRFEQQLAQQGGPRPSRAALAREVLDRLISERAQLQLARDMGIKVEDATVDVAEQNVARQNGMSVTDLRQRVTAQGIAPAQFRDELRNQLVLSRLRDRELQARVKVDELEVDRYLQEQEQGPQAGGNVQINLAHILVAVPERASDSQLRALQAKARQVMERARAGEDFAKLARENSDAPGAGANGGQIGLRSADRYPPLFMEAVQNVPQGGIAEVVRSAAGFHVIKVIEKRKGLAAQTVTQSRARHILLRPSAQLSESAARARLAEFKRRVLAGHADFAQLAREHSQDASARNGGDLGWASPGMFVPEFEEAMNALAPGQIADPIVSRFGVHLIQLLQRREAALSEKELRELARAQLREKKLDEAYARWAQEVRGRAFVELREPPQ